MTSQQAHGKIRENIDAHNKVAARYEERHPEIFNDIEQARLARDLAEALHSCRTGRAPLLALDMGCGSGNLTRHLVALGCRVVAADISQKFLELVASKFPRDSVSTNLLNGEDLREFADAQFDFTATYSVLHHLPEYLPMVREMARVTRPGGVIYIDHEVNENYWSPPQALAEFRARVKPPDPPTPGIERFFKLSTWRRRLREWGDKDRREIRRQRRANPRWIAEGDIHVWPDDHIEWSAIEELLAECHFEIIFRRDYLHADARHPREVYEDYARQCSDMRVLAMRKKSGA